MNRYHLLTYICLLLLLLCSSNIAQAQDANNSMATSEKVNQCQSRIDNLARKCMPACKASVQLSKILLKINGPNFIDCCLREDNPLQCANINRYEDELCDDVISYGDRLVSKMGASDVMQLISAYDTIRIQLENEQNIVLEPMNTKVELAKENNETNANTIRSLNEKIRQEEKRAATAKAKTEQIRNELKASDDYRLKNLATYDEGSETDRDVTRLFMSLPSHRVGVAFTVAGNLPTTEENAENTNGISWLVAGTLDYRYYPLRWLGVGARVSYLYGIGPLNSSSIPFNLDVYLSYRKQRYGVELILAGGGVVNLTPLQTDAPNTSSFDLRGQGQFGLGGHYNFGAFSGTLDVRYSITQAPEFSTAKVEHGVMISLGIAYGLDMQLY